VDAVVVGVGHGARSADRAGAPAGSGPRTWEPRRGGRVRAGWKAPACRVAATGRIRSSSSRQLGAAKLLEYS
jgi:hypothetical protein